MGIVICFPQRMAPPAVQKVRPAEPVRLDCAQFDAEQAVLDELVNGGDQAGMVAAAGELISLCRDRYGFLVMQDGLPRDPGVLADTLVGLLRGLALLQEEFTKGPLVPGLPVCFGRPALALVDDGRGGPARLAVPDGVDATELAGFLRPRLERMARR